MNVSVEIATLKFVSCVQTQRRAHLGKISSKIDDPAECSDVFAGVRMVRLSPSEAASVLAHQFRPLNRILRGGGPNHTPRRHKHAYTYVQ